MDLTLHSAVPVETRKKAAQKNVFSRIRSRATAGIRAISGPNCGALFNTRIKAGESMRVFPLSNWTELDVWEYIKHENIPVVPLYFAKVRPIVVAAAA